MGRRLAIATIFFLAAGVATGVLGRSSPPLLGPLSALSLGALGALLIALAPGTPVGAAANERLRVLPEAVKVPIAALPQMTQVTQVSQASQGSQVTDVGQDAPARPFTHLSNVAETPASDGAVEMRMQAHESGDCAAKLD